MIIKKWVCRSYVVASVYVVLMYIPYKGLCLKEFYFEDFKHHHFENNTLQSKSQIDKLCFVAGATHRALIYWLLIRY